MSSRTRTASHKVILGLGLLAYLVLAMSSCGGGKTGTEVDQSTPEATIRAMYRAVEGGDARFLESLIAPSDPTRRQTSEVLDRMNASNVTYELVDLEVFMISNDGKTALMSASEHARLHQNDKVLTDTEGSINFTLTNTGGKWYLVGLWQWPSPGWVQP
jgi:uncharacterized protein YchJ